MMKWKKNAVDHSLPIFTFLFLFLFPLCRCGTNARAATVTQTAQTTNSASITWTPPQNVLNYRIYVKENDSAVKFDRMQPAATLAADQTSYTITGLKAGNTYNVKIEYDSKYSKQDIISTYTMSQTTVKTLPSRVTGVKQRKWWYYANSVAFTWNRQTEVSGYQWILFRSSGKKLCAGRTADSRDRKDIYALSKKKVSNSEVYTVQVRAYQEINGRKKYGAWSPKAYLFPQPMVKSAAVEKGRLAVSWNRVKGATGYDIYVSKREKKGYKKVKSCKKSVTSTTMLRAKGKEFSSKKKYYIYIVAKKKVGKVIYTSGRHYSYDVKHKMLKWSFE